MRTKNHRSGQQPQVRQRRRSIALLGCDGFNVNNRLVEELQRLAPHEVYGYDLVDTPKRQDCFQFVHVEDDEDLAQRLRKQRPTDVLIETPDDVHAKHIAMALDLGARVFCEKPVATTGLELANLRKLFTTADLERRLFIIDHYKNLDLVQVLKANGRRWLGEIKRIKIVLLESQGIGPDQIRSHAQGMANFLHHVLAFASMFLDLRSFEPTTSMTANHPDSPVPDTYRAAVFQRNGSTPAVIQGAVGKYIEHPRKAIFVEGTRGWANLDRERNELRVECNDGWSISLSAKPDSGYRGLARALTMDESQMSLVSFPVAVEALRLLEAAQQRADWLTSYPSGRTQLFSGTKSPTKRAA